MNRLFNQLLLLFTASIALFACSKDKSLDHTKVSQVAILFTPEENRFVKLQPTTSSSVVFEWEQARAEDGGLVMYEVVFDKEGGDFSQPVYKMLSDNGGVFNKATVSHKTLNSIANLAGIASLETGKLKWTIVSSKGINAVQSTVSRLIEVERPAGFATIPADVYLTGDASEGGTDVNNALQLKQVSNGIFEIYTSLKAGTYQFIDRKTGDAAKFYVDGTALKESGSTTVTGDTKVYRVLLDFNNAAATYTQIKEVSLWFAPDNTTKFNLPYAGHGAFKAENVKVDFKQEGWGRDERYKFRMQVSDGTTDSYEWYGSSNADNQRPTDATPASFYFLHRIQNNDQWNYCYKFKTEADGANIDVIVDFSTDKEYTHQVVIK
jgi:hypothetical protein